MKKGAVIAPFFNAAIAGLAYEQAIWQARFARGLFLAFGQGISIKIIDEIMEKLMPIYLSIQMHENRAQTNGRPVRGTNSAGGLMPPIRLSSL